MRLWMISQSMDFKKNPLICGDLGTNKLQLQDQVPRVPGLEL